MQYRRRNVHNHQVICAWNVRWIWRDSQEYAEQRLSINRAPEAMIISPGGANQLLAPHKIEEIWPLCTPEEKQDLECAIREWLTDIEDAGKIHARYNNY